MSNEIPMKSSVGSGSGAHNCTLEESGRENYFDISKIHYLRCTKTMYKFRLIIRETTGLVSDDPS